MRITVDREPGVESETSPTPLPTPARHDYDVVLFQGDRLSKSAARKLALFSLVDVAICVAAISLGRWLVIFSIGLVLTLQLLALQIRARRFSSPATEDPYIQSRVTLILKELCIRANCAAPVVALKQTIVVAGVVVRNGRVLFYLSPDFVTSVDDGALRAIIAHEVAHLTNHDLRRNRVRARTVTIAYVVVWFIALMRVGIDSVWELYGAMIVYVVPCMNIVLLSLSFQNQKHEFRADLVGAQAVGDPRDMIRGLEVVDVMSRDLRERFFEGPWRWALIPLSLRSRSHPSLSLRVQRLDEAAGVEPGFS
jgi:Zn-dependent protease with chaperone function